MSGISVCVISFNEESKLGDCLRSVQTVADEIVVVDSCSTDRTQAIAAEHGARVIEQPFLGYIEQKNFAIDHASHDWILSLDCDERLSDELLGSIVSIKNSLRPGVAYRMSRRTFYVYRWLNHCWYPDRKVRLFHRGHCRWSGTNPHDHVAIPSGEIVDLSGDILHYSFDSVFAHLDTINRFTEIGAREAYARGERAGVFSPIAHGTAALIKHYILKSGWRDGFAGLTASVLSGVHAYVKHSKIRMMAIEKVNPASRDD